MNVSVTIKEDLETYVKWLSLGKKESSPLFEMEGGKQKRRETRSMANGGKGQFPLVAPVKILMFCQVSGLFSTGIGPLKGALQTSQRWASPWSGVLKLRMATPCLICHHSPVYQLLVPSLIANQGSFSCSNKVITSGLGMQHPAHKKVMPCNLEQINTCK